MVRASFFFFSQNFQATFKAFKFPFLLFSENVGFVIGKRQKLTGGVDACGSEGGQQGTLEWGETVTACARCPHLVPQGGERGGPCTDSCACKGFYEWGSTRRRRDVG